jgi:hypothetical protein
MGWATFWANFSQTHLVTLSITTLTLLIQQSLLICSTFQLWHKQHLQYLNSLKTCFANHKYTNTFTLHVILTLMYLNLFWSSSVSKISFKNWLAMLLCPLTCKYALFVIFILRNKSIGPQNIKKLLSVHWPSHKEQKPKSTDSLILAM